MFGESKIKDYLSSVSNYFDISSLVFNGTTLILRRFVDDDDLHKVRLMASIGIIAIYWQAFYWLRI